MANELRDGALSPGLARLAAPHNGALVKGSQVRVRVRLDRMVREFRAWLDQREVTGAFRQGGPGRTATLRPAPGVNHLHVRVGDGGGRRDFDTVRFIRARRTPGLLRLRPAGRRARGGRVRLRLRLGRGVDHVRGRLNGRPLGRVLGSGRRRSIVLDGNQGLRFGRNRLRLLAVDEAGGYDLERRTVIVPRTRPIPAAGAPPTARLGRVIRLDARRSRAAHARGGLGYRWRLVERPRGSRARLRGARGASPRLRPDKTGRYRVRLLVFERPGEGARSTAASPRSVDVATIAAAPDIPPVGVPIDTVAPGGVTLGAPVNQSFPAPDPTQPLQLVALDRSDLSLVSNRSYGGDDTGTAQLLGDVNALSSDSLAIVLSPYSHNLQEIDTDTTAVTNVNSAISAIGAPTVPTNILVQERCDGNCSNFSAIGVPGTASGGTVNPGLSLAPNGDSASSTQSDLRGYLQLDSSGNYTYVNGDYVPFDTFAPGSTDQNPLIQVGRDQYTPPGLPAGQGGFTVLVLDSGRLTYRNAGTWAVSGVPAATAASNLAAMDSMLESAAGDPGALTFIQTIGAVDRVDSAVSQWDLVAGDQTDLGGHGYYLNALDGASEGSYAFVGPGDPPSYLSPYALTASKSATGGSGRLVGLLGRSSQSQFYPKIGGTVPTLDMTLPGVVYGRSGPWPDRDTAGHNAAIACIAASLKPALPMPIEDNYTDDNVDWDSNQTQLSKFTYAGLSSQCDESFSADDFTDVQSQLTTEWAYLGTVGKLVDNLQEPLLGGYSTFQAHVADVFQDIQTSVTPPPDSTTTASAAQISIDVLWMASYIPGIGDAFGLLAGFGQLALDTSNDTNGTPDGDSFEASPTEVPDELAERLQTLYSEMDSVEDILVSDWGKLSTAAQRAVTSWQWDDRIDYGHARDVFDASMTKQAWESLFPVEYTTYEFGDAVPTDARTFPCTGYAELTMYGPFYPFSGLPNAGYTVVTGAGPQTNLWAFGKVDDTFLKYQESDRDPDGTPSADLFNDMFVNSPSGSTVEGPPLPSQLRFDLEAYDTRPVITYIHNDQVPGSEFCAVNGNMP